MGDMPALSFYKSTRKAIFLGLILQGIFFSFTVSQCLNKMRIVTEKAPK